MNPNPASWPDRLPRRLPLPVTGLADNLAASARRYPAQTAIAFHGREIAYAELARRVEVLAAHLARAGSVRPGDRVVVAMQNSPAFVVATYAVLHLGAVVVPANPMLLGEELHWIVADSGARVACVAQDLWPRFAPLRAEGLLRHVVVAHYGADLPPQPDPPVPEAIAEPPLALAGPGVTELAAALNGSEHAPLHEVGGETLAILAYTSGTTGRPKGCKLSHRALQAAALSLAVWNRWFAGAVALATAPFFHITGLVGSMNLPLMAGATMVVLPRWDRAAAVALIERHRVTHWTNVPTMITDLLALPGIASRDLSSLLYVGGGGTAMPEAVAARLHELAGIEYQEGWGLTEVCGAIHLNPPGRERRQCLGIPVFGVDSRVVAIDGSGRVLPAGEKGEIVTRGPTLFSGYWNQPEATEAAFVTVDGERYFRTGDIGHVDAEGYYHLADRLKRMVNVSGYKVWPAEVEAMLYKHPAVQEACVIGVADAQRGELVKAFVVPKDGVPVPSADELIEWSRQQMAAYKIPRQVEFVASLPKSGAGKILWRRLQEQASAG